MKYPGKAGKGFTPEAVRMELGGAGTELWFTEREGLGQGSGATFRIENVLTRFKSSFQEVAVLETLGFGRMLILDGVIMVTEFDEAGYHEMIAHVPLLCHPDPRRVLIIGGGDGGTVREVVKHPGVERVVLCEIDPAVVETCREFLPGLASGLDDPRVEVVHADGALYAAENRGRFEVIIVDSSDPLGPAEVLFQRPFYETLNRALSGEGIAVTQSESFFYHPTVIRGLFGFIPRLFPLAAYYRTSVPTYPSGSIGFSFCSKGPHPTRDLDPARAGSLTGLRYYSPAVHRAAFCLPPLALDLLPDDVRRFQEDLAGSG